MLVCVRNMFQWTNSQRISFLILMIVTASLILFPAAQIFSGSKYLTVNEELKFLNYFTS